MSTGATKNTSYLRLVKNSQNEDLRQIMTGTESSLGPVSYFEDRVGSAMVIKPSGFREAGTDINFEPGRLSKIRESLETIRKLIAEIKK